MFCKTTIFNVKIWNHPIGTTIYKWLFGVPDNISRWWQLKYFLCSLRKLGNILLFVEHIFQVGWNHQLDIHHLEVVCLVGDSFYFRNHSSLCFSLPVFVNIYFQPAVAKQTQVKRFSLLSLIATSLHLKDTWMSQEVSRWFVNGLKPTYRWGILGSYPTY